MEAKASNEAKFVGRKTELKKLQGALNNAISCEGSTIFISGEAGSGKTRLVLELFKLAKDANIQVMAGWCLSNTTLPYFPFTEAFESYLSQTIQP